MIEGGRLSLSIVMGLLDRSLISLLPRKLEVLTRGRGNREIIIVDRCLKLARSLMAEIRKRMSGNWGKQPRKILEMKGPKEPSNRRTNGRGL
jgi:hypothetical protein